ncbi:MAG: hypothetical protein ACI4EI_09815 [Muricoprocola sp.]
MNRNKLLKTTLIGAVASLMIAAPASASYGTVTADLLTVRSAPSVESEAVGMLSWGDDVCITYVPSDDWYEIYLNDGCYYVSSEFVSCGDSSGNGYSDPSYSESSYESAPAYEETASASSGEYLGNFTLTAYCSCASCCGYSNGITASGTVATAGRTVAMGGVPFGTKLLINGNVYTVEDRGTAYGVVDIYMDSHSEALAFGMQTADVYQVY